MRKTVLRPLLLLGFLALSGCSAIAALDRASTSLDVHEIRAPAGVATAPTRGVQLSVEVPATSGAINTDRIVVRTGSTQIAYLPDARWSATAPEMLQGAMVETLLATSAFTYVGRRPLGASGDLALVSTLIDFGAVADVESETATITMTLVAQMVREQDASIVARRTFERSVTVSDTASATIIDGYAQVSEAVLTDLARWATSRF